MALVTGGRSTLNPNAPLFIPAAMRQVEDFSPKWWDLVTTSPWFRDYWVSQHPGEDVFGEVEDDGFNGNNAVQMLPDSIDLDVDEDILNMESQFEEFLQSSEAEYGYAGRGFDRMDAQLKSPGVSPRDMTKYWEKPVELVSPRYSPRFIQQPF